MAPKKPTLDPIQQTKYEMITRNLQETLGDDRLMKILASGETPHIYWGTAPTGRPHIGYFVPMSKIADFLKAGCKVTVLFADLHAYLDNMKSSWHLLEKRVAYYEEVIKTLLECVNVPLERLHFVRGTQYQLDSKYTTDVLRLSSFVTQHDAQRAGADVVKQVESPPISGLLYPLLQAIDEHHLNVDAQFGGVDQRKIFILAEEQLPRLKLFKRVHLMNPMVAGLAGSKMSSSEERGKIDVLDSFAVVSNKIDEAMCEPGRDDQNGVIAFAKYVVFPLLHGDAFHVETTTSVVPFIDFESLQSSFSSGSITPIALKSAMKSFVNRLLKPIRAKFDADQLLDLVTQAYPALSQNGSVSKKVHVSDMTLLSDVQQKHFDSIVADLNICGNSSRLKSRIASSLPIRLLWTIFPIGRPHIGLFIPLMKLACFVKLGIQVTILLADINAFLMDSTKCVWEKRNELAILYEKSLKAMLKKLDVPLSRISFAHGVDFQLKRDYILDIYKLAGIIKRDDAHKAGMDIIPQRDHPVLGSLLCPLLQAIDEHHFDVDVHFGDESQINSFLFAETILPELDYDSRTHLTYPLISGLISGKMTVFNTDSTIDLTCSMKKKLKKAFCEPGNIVENFPLSIVENIVFPLLNTKAFFIPRSSENGGEIRFVNFAQLQAMFKQQQLHPGDLKLGIEVFFNDFLQSIRAEL